MKLSVTYRATIDRSVPIIVAKRIPTRIERRLRGVRSFFVVRERVRFS